MREIVLVNQYTTQIFLDVTLRFLDAGYKVTLLTGKVDSQLKFDERLNIVSSITYRKKSLITRLLSWALFALHFFWYLFIKKRTTQFIVTTNPPLVLMVMIMWTYLKPFRYSLLIYDLYPDILTQMGYFGETNIFIKVWRRINLIAYKRAKSIITISENMRDKLAELTSTDITVIYNWADNDRIKPIEKSENWFAKTHDLIDDRVVLYSGNFGLTHNIEPLLQVANQLDGNEDIKFILIGNGEKKKHLEKLAHSMSLNKVQFLPFQSERDLPFSMAVGDIGIVTLDEKVAHLSVPSKTYYLMASGCALLCMGSSESELGRLVQKYGVGEIFAQQDIEGMRDFVLNTSNEQLMEYKKNSVKASFQFTSSNADLYLVNIEKTHVS